MRIRRWVGLVTVAALLLHAVTLARHNVIRFQAIAAELAAPTGLNLAAICYVAVEADSDGPAPAIPGDGQDGTSKPCPICLGLIPVHALPTSEAPAPRIPVPVFVARFIPQKLELAPAVRFSLPPTRGPPSIA
jgi:hypothetical protein